MPGVDAFTPDERRALAPYFTELDGPVFALVNLPEVVKGALFARYSRSAKSLRRLFLDEFLERAEASPGRPAPSGPRARRAALRAGVHRVRRRLGRPARRRAPGLRGRVQHPDQGARVGPAHGLPRAVHALRALHGPAGRPLEVPRARGARRPPAARALRRGRSTARSRPTRAGSSRCASTGRARVPRRPAADTDAVYRMTIRAKALDSAARAPARGHALERRHLRHRPGATRRSCCACARTRCAEVRDYADLMLVELRKVIPAFLRASTVRSAAASWSRLPRGDRARRPRRRRPACSTASSPSPGPR